MKNNLFSLHCLFFKCIGIGLISICTLEASSVYKAPLSNQITSSTAQKIPFLSSSFHTLSNRFMQFCTNNHNDLVSLTIITAGTLAFLAWLNRSYIVYKLASYPRTQSLLQKIAPFINLQTFYNTDDKYFTYPTQYAINNNNLFALRFLIEKLKQSPTKLLHTALNKYAKNADKEGRFKIVTYLIKNNTNFNINEEDFYKDFHAPRPPLYYAIKNHNLKLVTYFIEDQKANFTQKYFIEWTPLHHAIYQYLKTKKIPDKHATSQLKIIHYLTNKMLCTDIEKIEWIDEEISYIQRYKSTFYFTKLNKEREKKQKELIAYFTTIKTLISDFKTLKTHPFSLETADTFDTFAKKYLKEVHFTITISLIAIFGTENLVKELYQWLKTRYSKKVKCDEHFKKIKDILKNSLSSSSENFGYISLWSTLPDRNNLFFQTKIHQPNKTLEKKNNPSFFANNGFQNCTFKFQNI